MFYRSSSFILFIWLLGLCSTVHPQTADEQRIEEMKRTVRETIERARQLEESGDRAAAIILKNKARTLLNSLQIMLESEQQATASTTATESVAELSQADAVLGLDEAIRILNLLGEREIARRVQRILDRKVASPDEARKIIEYYEANRPSGLPSSTSNPRNDGQKDTAVTPKPGKSAEQLENELTVFVTAMNALLDADLSDEARILAQSIMDRRKALKQQNLAWTVETADRARQEINVVKLASRKLFESDKTVSANAVDQLAVLLEREYKQNHQVNNRSSAGSESKQQDGELVTRLVQRIRSMQLTQARLQAENRALQKKIDDLNNQLKQSDK